MISLLRQMLKFISMLFKNWRREGYNTVVVVHWPFVKFGLVRNYA